MRLPIIINAEAGTMKSKFVQYYVEGEDEGKFIHTLKSDLCVIRGTAGQQVQKLPLAVTP